MTERAVKEFVSRGVVNDVFRTEFISGKMTRREIAGVDPNLDLQDVNVIMLALMGAAGDFPSFSATINSYIEIRYRSGKLGGDNLPISV